MSSIVTSDVGLSPTDNTDNTNCSANYAHNPDEFIDIHGSQTNPSVQTITQGVSNVTLCHTETTAAPAECSSTLEARTNGTNSQGLKLPVQETAVLTSGTTIVYDGESDDEYQSADDGDYGDDDDTSDDFIPTDDLLENGSANNPHGNTTTNAAAVEGVQGEGSDKEVSETEEEQTVDPLEERRVAEQSLSQEERQECKAKGQEKKDEGNTKFRSCLYNEAIESYTEALDICPLEFHKERSIMFANRAACKMKQELYEDAISDSSEALELHPHYLKAMLRRAELYEKTEKLDEALKDYQKVVELDPSQHAARAACVKLAEQIKDRNEKMKEEMMGKLKDLGNMILRPFGLSTNNFNLQQDPNTGSYSMQFNQNPGNGV